jgi:hypothetical protein
MFKNLDLYKGIILVSLLLLPVSLGYLWWIQGQKVEAEKAIASATASKGELFKIGEIVRKLDTVEKNLSRGGESESHRIYFERKILKAANDGAGLSNNDFVIGNEVSAPVTGNKAVDQVVGITFKRAGKDFDLSRDFIHAMIWNCETGGSQIWKLRTLKIRNSEATESARKRKAPPKTIADDWRLEKLEFARREPVRKS